MSQKSRIREALLCGITITKLEALRWFGSLNFGARIGELREEGMNITTTMVKLYNGKTVAKYRLRGRSSLGG